MQNGKNIKVFLSSTFKDMDAERDLIMNRVAPTLQQLLAPQGITLQFIDLRWGVNTQDADENERENIVLRECISEIRQSRPFFIGLLGDRYGWIPSVESWQVMLDEMTDEERMYIRKESREQKSVTELEMLFGALMDTSSLRRSLFCFRNPAVYEQMDDVARLRFCNLNDEADRKLASLKQKIVDVLPSEVKVQIVKQIGKCVGSLVAAEPHAHIMEDFINQAHCIEISCGHLFQMCSTDSALVCQFIKTDFHVSSQCSDG